MKKIFSWDMTLAVVSTPSGALPEPNTTFPIIFPMANG